ncbi:MAG TPA: hypothetical protein VFL42_08815, partial [Terriglobales bacterium]|nr:hypothetical protein [Terriglobales bacterium]
APGLEMCLFELQPEFPEFLRQVFHLSRNISHVSLPAFCTLKDAGRWLGKRLLDSWCHREKQVERQMTLGPCGKQANIYNLLCINGLCPMEKPCSGSLSKHLI